LVRWTNSEGSFAIFSRRLRIVQGPFSDAMTHAGQLAMLRRLAGAPVAPENFILAEISPDRLGPDQAEPASPDAVWREAPAGWSPSNE